VRRMIDLREIRKVVKRIGREIDAFEAMDELSVRFGIRGDKR